MSAFVLKREYALQLPTSYVDVDRDEMEYVDGGAHITYISNSKISFAVAAIGFAGKNIGWGKLLPYIPVLFSWVNALPLAGQVAFAYIVANAANVAVKTATALATGKGINVDLKWYGISLSVA